MPDGLRISFNAARQAGCHVCYIVAYCDLTMTKVLRTHLVRSGTKRLILCGSGFLRPAGTPLAIGRAGDWQCMGDSKNSEFAQRQGAEKISPRRI